MRALLLSVATLLASPPAGAETLAIVHARVWTMTAPDPVPDATIVIEGGKVVSVTASGAAPSGAVVIDAAGQPVTPGLVNAATQIGLIEVSGASGTRDDRSLSKGFSAGFDVSSALNGNSVLVALARADGMTAALSFPSSSQVAPFNGQAALVRLRPGSDILDRANVALFVTIGGGAWVKEAGSRAIQWQILRAALDDVRAKKTPAGLGPQDGAVLSRLLAGEIPLAIRTDRESDIRQAARFAADERIRVVIVGGAEAWRAADTLVAAHIPVVLDPESNLPDSFDELGNRLDAAAILDKAGVTIAFGLSGGAIELSYNAGLNLRGGAGLAVANGLPYYRALQAITVNPRAIWGGGSATLEPGKPADIVIWDGDPLEPGTNARAVILDGVTVPIDTRQRALAERYRAAP
jgi:imidazolonepropionase-like amidohydrolase